MSPPSNKLYSQPGYPRVPKMRRKEVKKILNELKMGFLLSRVYYAGNMFYISALRGDDRWFLIDDSLVLREGRWGTFFFVRFVLSWVEGVD